MGERYYGSRCSMTQDARETDGSTVAPAQEAQGRAGGAGNGGDRERYVRGRRAAVVGVAGNLVLAAAKLVLALLTGSIALMADAVHTASDMLTSIVVWIGLRVARRPEDEQHPYGHGRAETIAALVVGLLLGVAGINFAWEAVRRMADPPEIGGAMGGLGLLLTAGFISVTVAAKAWMGFYASRVGRQIENQSLLADAWHHYSDALSSVLVVIALVSAGWGYYGADAWLGLGVAVMILYTGWYHVRKAASALLGEAPKAQTIEAIKTAARAVHGVKDVHAVTVHDYGLRKVASLHITLLGGLTLDDAHRVATEVEHALARRLGIAALVHAEPEDARVPQSHLDHVRETVQRLLVEHPGIVSFHALTVQPEDHGLEVEFHAYVPPGTPIEASHRLEHDVADSLARAMPGLHVHLHIEPCPLACDACPGTCGVAVPRD